MWVMLHSGSRGIGNAIGRYFIEQAKREMRRWFINLPDKDLAYFAEGSKPTSTTTSRRCCGRRSSRWRTARR